MTIGRLLVGRLLPEARKPRLCRVGSAEPPTPRPPPPSPPQAPSARWRQVQPSPVLCHDLEDALAASVPASSVRGRAESSHTLAASLIGCSRMVRPSGRSPPTYRFVPLFPGSCQLGQPGDLTQPTERRSLGNTTGVRVWGDAASAVGGARNQVLDDRKI